MHFLDTRVMRRFSIMARYRQLRPDNVVMTTSPPSPFSPSIQPTTTSRPHYVRNPVPVSAKTFQVTIPIQQPPEPRRLRIALIGAPNAGKTSLLNTLLNEQIGAVSSKKNTTRESIEGVMSVENFQFEFVDCPGIVPINQSDDARALSAEAWKNFNSCDCALVVVDTVKRPDGDFLSMLRKLAPKPQLRAELEQFIEHSNESSPETTSRPIILVLNKMDLVTDRKWLKVRNMQLSEHAKFSNSFYISAKENKGVGRIVDYLKTIAVPGEWQFPKSVVTSLSRVDQVEQLVRGFLFTWFNKDVPYKITQKTVGWTERLDGSLVIEHELTVKDSVVARMVLGTKAKLVQRLKDHVARKLEKKWKIEKVVFQVHVKAETQRESKRDREKRENNHHETNALFSRGGGAVS